MTRRAVSLLVLFAALVSTFGTSEAGHRGGPLKDAVLYELMEFRRPFFFHHIAVYKSDHGTPIPVRPDERALGDATVRVEISFD